MNDKRRPPSLHRGPAPMQRVIESDAIRALVGYVEQRDGLGDWPSLDEEEAEAERAEQRQRDTTLPSCQM